MRNFPALWGHTCETGVCPCASKHLQQCSSALLILKPSMAFKIPLLDSLSLTQGYFHDIPNFRWADVTDKDEIGKRSFGSVMKGNYIPKKKTVVVKRCFGEGDSNLKMVAKEAKMLQNLRYPKVAEFVAVCPKPVAIMMEYKCFDFLPFGLDVQVSDLLDLLHCLDRIQTVEAFEENMSNFKTRLQNRDYPARIVEKHLSEIQFSDREMSLAQKKKTAPKKILPFVTQYHPALPNLTDTFMGKLHLIENQPQLREIFKEPPIISYRKGKSLKDILVKAKL